MADEITIIDNIFVADSENLIISALDEIGTSFQALETANVTSAIFSLSNSGSSTGNIVVYIYACDGSYEPVGSPIAASELLDKATIGATKENITFTFDGTIELVAGEKYAAVVAGGSGGSVRIGYDSGSGHTPGGYVYSTDGGTSFLEAFSFACTFAVYGSSGGGGGGGGGGNIPTDVALFESWGF